MSAPELLSAVFSLIDYYNFPYEIQQAQFKLLAKVADHMSEARALDILKKNGLSRLIKCYPQHNPRFQPVIGHLIQKVVINGKKNFDVKSLFSLTQTSLPNIQELGMKALVTMSENVDPNQKSSNGTVQAISNEYMRSIDAEFENYIPHIVEMCRNSQKYSEEMRMNALQIMANLSLKDYLRPQIFAHKGMDLFLEVIRKSN
mmetsp:Transcript_12699/g.12543  ORF Transcript_12699/g.12543 Transcript_12699/m.12543 type:complete len:202 (+) Transcript_12699:1446-2051(+)